MTWGHATAGGGVTSYLVSALGGQGSPSIAVPGDATAARLTGLAAGTYTFQVTGLNPYGSGPAATTKSFSVTGSATTYASTVLSSSPSVFYRLADSAPHAMADSSGGGATGAYTAQSTLGQPGPLAADAATAISDNANGPAAGGNPSLPLYAQPRTLEGWIKTTSTGTQYLAGYGNESTSQGFAVALQPDDVVVQGYSDDLTFTSAAALDDGSWHFVTVTSTGTSATVYVDGTSLGTQDFAVALDTIAAPQGLQIGAGVQGCCGYFNGDLADVAVFPAALTSAQVTAQFAASGLGRPPAPGSPSATAGANQATVSWSAPACARPGGDRLSGHRGQGQRRGQRGLGPGHGHQRHRDRPGRGTAYTFRVQALNEYGAGATATTAAVTPTGAALTYASTVLASGPSVFYRLADTYSGALADSSGGAATGTYTRSPPWARPARWATTRPPRSARMATARRPAATLALPLYAQPRTLEGWINTTSGNEEFLALADGSTSTGEGFALAVQPHDVVVQGYSDDLSFTSAAALNDGTWHFVVVTSTGTSATVYVDGTSLGIQTFAQTLNTQPAPLGLLVGSGPQGCCGYVSGGVADVAVFPAALTAAKVTAQFAASGLGRPGAPGSPSATAGANQATVSWSAPAGADPAVTGYLVTAVTGSTAANAVSVPATASSTTVTGLAGGTAYTFRIQALNAYGAGAAATTAAVTPTGAALTYASTVLAAGPSVFYRLADTDRGAMADSSGNGATGAYTAQPTLGQPRPLVSDPATAISSNASARRPAAIRRCRCTPSRAPSRAGSTPPAAGRSTWPATAASPPARGSRSPSSPTT